MTGIGGCRSSGAFTADALLVRGAGKLISITGLSTISEDEEDDTAYVVLHDCLTAGAASAANTIGILYVGTTAIGSNYAESDFHGVKFTHGLFAEVTHVTGSATKFLVTFN